MPARRAPEGPGVHEIQGETAVRVGGGGAWPDSEPTRRAKLAARTARGRAAAHGHNKQPGTAARHGSPAQQAQQPGLTGHAHQNLRNWAA